MGVIPAKAEIRFFQDIRKPRFYRIGIIRNFRAIVKGPIFSGGVLKSHIRLPHFPDLSHQIRAGFQGWLSRPPARGRSFSRFPHVLEGLDLTYEFGDVPPYRGGEDFHGLNDPVRIDKKTAPNVHSRCLIKDSVQSSDLSADIGEHGEGDSSGDHLG
jgi:hypothetical protein